MLFSVVIPAFNRREFLPLTLESVGQQRFADYEVIVVDDGSTDGTVEHLRWLGSRARVLTQANRGPGPARNRGVAEARGEYVAFLDSDDVWFPWTLSIFASLIHDHQAPSILSARLLDFWQDAELMSVQESSVKADAFADYLAA